MSPALYYVSGSTGLPKGVMMLTMAAIHDGWLCIGDLAVMDGEWYVTIVDRKRDTILTGGENVYSTEVENVLYRHEAILEAAVVGVPDPHRGEAGKACVVLKEGCPATGHESISFCKQDLAGYKAPKSVDFLKALPKTGSGKIYKKGLRDPCLKRHRGYVAETCVATYPDYLLTTEAPRL